MVKRDVIFANWAAPKNVRALTTTRNGGVSQSPFDSFNLGQHVGDREEDVTQNRQQLITQFSLPCAPVWLEQVHSTRVLVLDGLDRLAHSDNLDNSDNLNRSNKANRSDITSVSDCVADAVYTRTAGQVCTIMTADCLPVVFCDKHGREVASAHAGWRGLCHGILEETLRHFSAKPDDIFVWLGPAIGPSQFEVGTDVRDAFMQHDAAASDAFSLQPNGKYLANLYQLAAQRLQAAGILPAHISGGEYCTMSDPQNFFSYRRDGQTGRMATLIWFE